jgi:hypothetical protein
LDAKDGRMFEGNIKQLTESNNKQVKINEIFNSTLNSIMKTINEDITPKILKAIANLDIINLVIYIDSICYDLGIIHDAITHAKLGVVTKNIIPQEQLEIIYDRLVKQGIVISSYHECLNYLESSVYYKNDMIFFEIKIPILENGFEHIFIYPIPNNDSQIDTEFENILIKGNETYAVSGKCLQTHDNFICKMKDLKDISEDECVAKLTRSEIGKCPHKIVKSNLSIKVVTEGSIVISSSSAVKLYNTCGSSNHTAIGSNLITFKDCSVTIEGKTFENHHIHRKTKSELLSHPFGLVKVTEIRKDVKIHELHEISIDNIESIDMIHRERAKTHYIMIIMFVIVILLIFGASLYVYCCCVKPNSLTQMGANIAMQALKGIEEGGAQPTEETIGGRMMFIPHSLLQSSLEK